MKQEVNEAADRLKAVIAPFVESSKIMAINMADQVIFKLNTNISQHKSFDFAYYTKTYKIPFQPSF